MARVDPTPLRRLSARLKLVLRREHQHVHEQPAAFSSLTCAVAE
jgi:hypothetical protein